MTKKKVLFDISKLSVIFLFGIIDVNELAKAEDRHDPVHPRHGQSHHEGNPRQGLARPAARPGRRGGNQDIAVTISLPMREAALMDVLGVFQSGNLTAAVTMRQES